MVAAEGMKWIGGGLVVLALMAFALVAAERRGPRASNTLRRELLDLGPTASPRPVHTERLLDAGTDVLLRGLFTLDRAPRVDQLLEATHASRGGLPPGMSLGTTGADSWSATPSVAQALAQRLALADATPEHCLDALALGRDLARGGGTTGLSAALQLTEAVFTSCAQLLTRHPEARSHEPLIAIIDGAPTLARAFREADLDLQLRTFGSWMRPQDIAELTLEQQRVAQTARVLPTAFFERHSLLASWSTLSKTTHAAMESLSRPPLERELILEALEAKAAIPLLGISMHWRSAITSHERRLGLLRMLSLAADLTRTTPMRALTEVEAGDHLLVCETARCTLTLREDTVQTAISLPVAPARLP